MARAETALSSARVLFEIGDADGTANRAYYAIFDAARAALLIFEAPWRATAHTHSGLMGAFDNHLVKTGLVPETLGRFLNQVHKGRTIADYQGGIELDDAQTLLEIAETFIDCIRKLSPPQNAPSDADQSG
jgi:uncharacterized protein (UPF0332 family)